MYTCKDVYEAIMRLYELSYSNRISNNIQLKIHHANSGKSMKLELNDNQNCLLDVRDDTIFINTYFQNIVNEYELSKFEYDNELFFFLKTKFGLWQDNRMYYFRLKWFPTNEKEVHSMILLYYIRQMFNTSNEEFNMVFKHANYKKNTSRKKIIQIVITTDEDEVFFISDNKIDNRPIS